MSLDLVENKDILAELGRNKKDGQIIVGFCMETENLISNAKDKLERKNCDMIVANDLKTENAGFKSDNNTVTIIKKDGEVLNLSKHE